jgi:uridine kinase
MPLEARPTGSSFPSTIRVLGIAGPSGSGKTTLARAVATRCDGVVFALDAYYHDQRDVDESAINVDVPEAIDVALALEHLRGLVAGRTVDQPVYDFATHARTDETRALAPAPFVFVEGLFALYWPELRALMHARVFVDLDHDECLRRRIERDVRQRGRTRAEVTSQYERKVRPMYERHVEPTRRHADVLLDGRADLHRLVEGLAGALVRQLPGDGRR